MPNIMKIATDHLKSGCILSKTLHANNVVLLERGVVLSKGIIARIKKENIQFVDIEFNEELKELDLEAVPETKEPEPEIELDLETIIEQENLLRNTFKKDYQKSVNKIKGIVENLNNGKYDKQQSLEVVNDILNKTSTDSNILLTELEGSDEDIYIFKHSMNTVVISLIIGKSMNYTEEQLDILGQGALLHDVGMYKVKPELFNKKGKLSEEEMNEVKKHIEYGLNLSKGVDKEIYDIIKYHHERSNGSGYPNGLTLAEIPEMARIVAIADVYSALTSDRKYRQKYNHFESMKILLRASSNLLDHKIVKKFLEFMPFYPLGSTTYLNGEIPATVSKANKNVFRPIIDIKKNGKIERLDLSAEEHKDKYISAEIQKKNQ